MEIEIIERRSNILFGLSPKISGFKDEIYAKADCYCVDLFGCLDATANGQWINSEIPKFAAKKGDKVSLLLDMDTGSIEYLLNGSSKGKYINENLQHGQYYLTLSLHKRDD
jgi:hypothetical protein